MVMSKVQRVFEALAGGEELTAKQIANRFQAGNPYEVVRQIRHKGYAVFCNPRTNRAGETKNFYRLGTPTREMVSIFYQVVDGRR